MLTLEEKSYIGGVIDGDGCITSSNANHSCNILSTTSYDYLKIVEKMLKKYKTRIDYHKERGNRKGLWSLKFSQKPDNLLPFLDEIEDYVVLKKPRIKILREIVKGKNIKENRIKLSEYNKTGKMPDGWVEPVIPKSEIYNKPYVAGLIDSEGSFRIYYRRSKKSYSPIISVELTSFQLIDYLAYILPYNVYVYDYTRKKINPNHKKSQVLTIPTKHQMRFINDIEPYLILKQPQIEVFKDFKLKRKSKPECFTTMKQLNQRGTNINIQIINNITINNPVINIAPQQTLLDKYFN